MDFHSIMSWLIEFSSNKWMYTTTPATKTSLHYILLVGLTMLCYQMPKFVSGTSISNDNQFQVNNVLKDLAISNIPNLDSALDLVRIGDNDPDISTMPVDEQLRLLSKQMNALMTRRKEDYKMLENSLKKFARKNALQFADSDLRTEINQLRQEIQQLKKFEIPNNKEHLTISWLSQSITEIRAELSEIQDASINASRTIQQKGTHLSEDISEIRDELKKVNLEISAIKLRQENTEKIVKELHSEAIQSKEDYRHNLKVYNQVQDNKVTATVNDYVELEADHRLRHQRFVRQQLHDLDKEQRKIKRHLNEIQQHRLDERIHTIEMEQHRMTNANFNLSRQVATLDRLHGSILELLEDIEGIQNKVDKTLPDIKREISKVEFNSAQLSAEQSLLREASHNAIKNIQAIAVSVSALQEERDKMKNFQTVFEQLQKEVKQIKSVSQIYEDNVHKRNDKTKSEINKSIDMNYVHDDNSNATTTNQSDKTLSELQLANNLVMQLESVEHQYESIVKKLPNDCAQFEENFNGLYLIAPIGQHHPVMAHCQGDWTTIQRRYDGSVDFNRTWDEYGVGFGTPAGEYWMGNDIIYELTTGNCSSLKIIMQDIYDHVWEATYKYFQINSREDGYRLTIGGYTGNASDALDYQNHMEFSAIDDDRDISNTHCAGNYEGGWWFSHCQHANLNGRYNLGLTWFDASRNEWIAVKSSHMMVSKRRDCGASDGSVINNGINTKHDNHYNDNHNQKLSISTDNSKSLEINSIRNSRSSTTNSQSNTITKYSTNITTNTILTTATYPAVV